MKNVRHMWMAPLMSTILVFALQMVLATPLAWAGELGDAPGAEYAAEPTVINPDTSTFVEEDDLTPLDEGGAIAPDEPLHKAAPGEAYEAGYPDIDSAVNAENAMTILRTFDPEGHNIVAYNVARGCSKFSDWLTQSDSNAEALDTAVHEEFHSYAFYKGLREGEAIYTGNGVDIMVPRPKVNVFRSSEMAEKIPQSLRTFRFGTYVGSSSDNTANLDGPYGLLNEFAAYSWGMNNQISLFNYYKEQGNVRKAWFTYIVMCGNNRLAYAEFRYWILRYLNYALFNHPAVYFAFLDNQQFVDAYCVTQQRFEGLITRFEDSQDDIASICSSKGYEVRVEDGFFRIGSHGIGFHEEDYLMLLGEIAKPEYQAVEKALFSKSTRAKRTEPAGDDAMFRLYNPNSGEHFYTASVKERDALARRGWKYEGIGWLAPTKSETPVYRLYNANAGDHHYTTSVTERDALKKAGWKYESIGWYSAGEDGTPLYRQYNPNAVSGSHNYTASKKENDALVNKYGWKAEGIGWYGVRQ